MAAALAEDGLHVFLKISQHFHRHKSLSGTGKAAAVHADRALAVQVMLGGSNGHAHFLMLLIPGGDDILQVFPAAVTGFVEQGEEGREIAAAESSVHGCAVENVHFHEVGSTDAMADVLNVCMLMHLLAPEKVYASSINVGGGTVKCAHGVLPVPAPATELILRGIPTYSGEIKSELCTPTGAALLRYFVDEFGDAPTMTVSMAGYGTGKKDFEVLNAVRVLLGETERQHDEVLELSCNIDDMTGEELGFAMERLFETGALDVWFTAIGMKKCRPGTMLSCLCRREQRDDMLRCIFKNTTTLGVREHVCARHVLSRAAAQQDSGIGTVGIKRASGWGVSRQKAEYDDLVKIAKETGMSLMEIKKLTN